MRGWFGVSGVVFFVFVGSAGATPLHFAAGERGPAVATVVAVGDVLMHEPLQRQAYTHGFATFFSRVQHLLAAGDVSYANMEGVVAPGLSRSGAVLPDPGAVYDGVVYSGYPQFNTHPTLLPALRDVGFDVMSTANNHSGDRGPAGVDATLDQMDLAGMLHFGTRHRAEDWEEAVTVTQAGPFRLGWLACTYGVNRRRDRDHQALNCYSDRERLLAQVRAVATRPGIDGVVVTAHWGRENSHVPRPQERELARDILEAGAMAVLGMHPHVLQPMEIMGLSDGREGFVAYSLANFVSGQSQFDQKVSMILDMRLTRDTDGRATVHSVAYHPVFMEGVEGGWYELVPGFGSVDPDRARRLVRSVLPEGNEL